MVRLHESSAGATRFSRQLPWWATAGIGLAAVGFGALLILRPFLSLGTNIVLLSVGFMAYGVSALIRTGRAWIKAVLALAWIALGVMVLLVPGFSIIMLTLAVGIILIWEGVSDGWRALRGPRADRAAGVMLGAATVILGGLALLWPDVTVVIIALIFGVRMVVFGSLHLINSVRRIWDRESTGRSRNPRSRLFKTVTAAIALVSTVGLAGLSIQLSSSPQPDSFYVAPADLPDRPGQLIRAEPFDRAIPAGAVAWRILYTTTRDDGRPAIASALVVTPVGEGDYPVIAWAHGTTGFAPGCAPSLLSDPFLAGAMPDLPGVLAEGNAVVATDYVGLGTAGAHPYLIGQGEGRSVLDSVRAARQLGEAQLAEATVIWGHSQGGHAALWAAGLEQTYAPALEIRGVAAMAPASNLPALFEGLSDSSIGSLFGSFALAAYVAEYSDVKKSDYVRPGALILADAMEKRCLTDPGTLVSVATALAGHEPIWSRDPGAGVLGERASENVPVLPIEAPLLIAQGGSDTLVLPEAQHQYARQRCDAGQQIDYRVYPDEDHLSVIGEHSPLIEDLHDWTRARFAGEPGQDTCLSVPG